MGVFGKKKSPSRRDERQLVEDRDDEGSDCDDNVGLEFESDESSSSLGGNKYEPPPTINSFIIATANANSIAADSGTAENTGTTSPRVAVATPSVEILRPEPNMQNKNTKGNAAIDSSIINHEPETRGPTGDQGRLLCFGPGPAGVHGWDGHGHQCVPQGRQFLDPRCSRRVLPSRGGNTVYSLTGKPIESHRKGNPPGPCQV
jgi:hypothetical protein